LELFIIQKLISWQETCLCLWGTCLTLSEAKIHWNHQGFHQGSTVLSGNRYLQFWWFIMVSHHFSQDLMARDWGIPVPVDPVFRQIHIFYMLRRRYLMVINAIISSYNKDQQKSLRLGRLPSSLTSGNQAWLAGKSIIDSFPAINLHLVRGFPSWPRLMTPEGKSIHHQY
jgi:hypothetical protein